MKNNDIFIETRTLKISLLDNELVYSETKPNTKENLEDAKENIDGILKIMEGRKLPMISDINNLKSQSKEARDHYSNSPICSAVALVTDSRLSMIIGNFFLCLNKATAPTKMFKSKEDALDWARKYM